MSDKQYSPEEVLNLQSAAYQKGYNEGYQLGRYEEAQQGAVWVKATTWPEDHNMVHWRRVEDKRPILIIGRNYQENIIAQFGKVYTPKELEWLDESATTSNKDEAVEFAEWIRNEDWEGRTHVGWINHNDAPDEQGSRKFYTTAQLHDLWQQSKKKV